MASEERRRSSSERLLLASVFWFAQIVAVSLLLGWSGHLSPGLLLACHALVTASVIAVALRRAGPRALLAQARARRVGGGGPGVLVGALSGALLAVLVLTLARGFFADPFGWDGLKYHLPMAALMRQEQRLFFGPLPNVVIDSYPRNAEIWVHLLLVGVGTDRWVEVGQVPFLLLGMLAVYRIARSLGSGRRASAAGALLLPFAPVVLSQLGTAYTDVTVSALVLASAALLLALRGERSRLTLAGFGCALGLLLGSKFSGLAFCAVFGAGAVAVLRRREGAWRPVAPQLAAIAALMFALGGSVYVHDVAVYGSPVYPFGVEIAGVELFAGARDADTPYGLHQTRKLSPLLRVLRSWSRLGETSHSAVLGGFGIAWPLLALVSLGSLVVSVRSRDVARLAAFGLFAALFLVTPLHFRVRFTLYLLGLGGVAFAHLLELRPPGAWLRRGLALGAFAVVVTGVAQVWPERYRPLFAGADARAALADRCGWAAEDSFQQAYRWLRDRAARGSVLHVFQRWNDVMPYCLWNRALDDRVVFDDGRDVAGSLDAIAARPGQLLFVDHRAEADALVREHPDRFEPVLVDRSVTLWRTRGPAR